MFYRHAVAVAAALLFVPALAPAQTPVGIALNTTYTQNFNTLTGTTSSIPPLVTSSIVPAGWAFAETGAASNTTYAAQNGSISTPDTYSFGPDGSTDRAFGAFGGTGESTGVTTTIGVRFQNTGAATLNALNVQFITEMWRKGNGVLTTDQFDFAYSTNATSLTDPGATWTALAALSVLTPGTYAGGPNTPVDGNLAANRSLVIGSVTGLTLPTNATIFLRWVDSNTTGREDGLGLDDFQVTPVPEPGSVLGLAAAALVAGRWVRRRRAAQRASA